MKNLATLSVTATVDGLVGGVGDRALGGRERLAGLLG
jgi:hypothetical protein